MGTIMVHKTATVTPIQYELIGKREDSRYMWELQGSNHTVNIWANPTRLYFRLFHGANTWSSAHFKVNKVKPGSWCQILGRKGECTPEENSLHRHLLTVYKDIITKVQN